MSDQETIKRFVFLRTQGWSFDRIAVELKTFKPTLIKWSRQYRLEIANLRATETEALIEAVFGARHERWRRLAAQLRAEIARETAAPHTPLEFAEREAPGALARHSRGAQPPRLWFGAPSRRTRELRNTPKRRVQGFHARWHSRGKLPQKPGRGKKW